MPGVGYVCGDWIESHPTPTWDPSVSDRATSQMMGVRMQPWGLNFLGTNQANLAVPFEIFILRHFDIATAHELKSWVAIRKHPMISDRDPSPQIPTEKDRMAVNCFCKGNGLRPALFPKYSCLSSKGMEAGLVSGHSFLKACPCLLPPWACKLLSKKRFLASL